MTDTATPTPLTEPDFFNALDALGVFHARGTELVDDWLGWNYDPELDDIEPSEAKLARARAEVIAQIEADSRKGPFQLIWEKIDLYEDVAANLAPTAQDVAQIGEARYLEGVVKTYQTVAAELRKAIGESENQ